MITRKFTIMALIFGIVLGAASTEGIHFYRQSYDSRIFQQRARCRAVSKCGYHRTGGDRSESLLLMQHQENNAEYQCHYREFASCGRFSSWAKNCVIHFFDSLRNRNRELNIEFKITEVKSFFPDATLVPRSSVVNRQISDL